MEFPALPDEAFPESVITFYAEDTEFALSEEAATAAWLTDLIAQEDKELGEISVIFCSDDYLHALNVEHLQHDDLTDIITFEYGSEKRLSGDLFISVDRVRDNAQDRQRPFAEELRRVMAHGLLHLAGYGDKAPTEVPIMRAKEDFYLQRWGQ